MAQSLLIKYFFAFIYNKHNEIILFTIPHQENVLKPNSGETPSSEPLHDVPPSKGSSSSPQPAHTDDSSYPPSILRKRPPVDQAVGEKRRAERRVRFREPEEVIEHGPAPAL
ncbi:hypothetical protein IHE44_0013640 [Lamprotornis superbus]|uniref:Uncharacterized protein n=1 Tax=Lamprotornis superbus TaxID=245042 RepID=A0A835P067_9PASS|nr:hypothetical protein IHE44_0013640 [Lamprotornis superbus]